MFYGFCSRRGIGVNTLQLFLEEERERELEALYETGIVDSLSRATGTNSGHQDTVSQVEVSSVTKQTTETLMAGERIMEAIDLADNERGVFQAYHDDMARLSEGDALRLQPPPRNPVLAAYDIEPDEYVLRVVEKVQSTALHDALLVLPFGKVVSLMYYLNIWAQKVHSLGHDVEYQALIINVVAGSEHHSGFTHHFLPSQNTPSPNCGQQSDADRLSAPSKTSPTCSPTTKGCYRL